MIFVPQFFLFPIVLGENDGDNKTRGNIYELNGSSDIIVKQKVRQVSGG